MKIVITGSLGNISRPLTAELVQGGHNVTVISSDAGKQAAIEAMGAHAAIGSLEDVAFLTATFTGADAVYTMVPPNLYMDHTLNLTEYYRRLGRNYAEAIGKAGVKRLVNLSSIGAHLDKGNGILVGANNVEAILNQLPGDVGITHMRPTSFYYNLYGYAHMIKNQGFIAANYGADAVIPWVSPVDIASAVAEELTTPQTGRKVRYVCSEELSGNDTAAILGEAIGQPGLQWKLISDEETLEGLKAAGMNPEIAAGLVEMYGALHCGLLAENYYRNCPAQLGKVKMKNFPVEFAVAFKKI